MGVLVDMNAQFEKLRDIFLQALERQGVTAQLEFAAEASAGDAGMFRELECMLLANDRSDGFLASQSERTENSGAAATPLGAQIGPYKLREQLGEGGMGVVYVAEQTEPVKRKVALKIIKPGMASKDVVARFEAERQALAMMDHPNIARVFDGGATESGQPYFVMELVQGLSLTEYCDQHKLSTEQRLKLFATVCRAVEHAHQKGIIHRDLKPSNIIVAEIDDAPVPKVIDFGVAKAIDLTLTNETLYTHFSQIVGTPLYMSPEQTGLGVVDVDTRSDVYSLGVLLYELLTGHTPFDSETLKRAGFDEMRRIIREDEPRRPSAVVSTLNAEALSTVAERRGSDPRKLSDALQGELDWLVMKALEKDRNRRYESAGALATDVHHYLAGEAVDACPPAHTYLLRKFVRRHRVAMGAAAAVAAALVLGIAGTTWQMLRAMDAERAADAHSATAEAEAERANREAAIAKAVNDFLNDDLLSQASPEAGNDPGVTLREILDRAAGAVGDKFPDQPLVRAAIHLTLGKTYESLGESQQAFNHVEQSLKLRQQHLGGDSPLTLQSMHGVGWTLFRLGRLTEAEEQLQEVVRLSRQLLGAEDEGTLAGMDSLATVIGARGRFDESEKLHRQVLEIRRRTRDKFDVQTALTLENLGIALQVLKRSEEAEQALREAIEIYAHNSDSLGEAMTTGNLASVFIGRGEFDEAEALLQQSIDAKTRILGAEHHCTLSDVGNLGVLHAMQGEYSEAAEWLQQALDAKRRTLGKDHPKTINATFNMAQLLDLQGRTEESAELMDDVLQLQRRGLGPDHPDTLDTLAVLPVYLTKLSRYDEAVQLARELLAARIRTAGDEADQTKHARWLLADILSGWAWQLAAVSSQPATDPEKAVKLAREALQLQPEEPNHAINLGVALYRSGEWREAVEMLQRADELLDGADREHRLFLAMAHGQLGDSAIAEKHYAAGAAWIAEQQPEDEQQLAIRGEAEELLGISPEQRTKLIDEHLASRVDPNEA